MEFITIKELVSDHSARITKAVMGELTGSILTAEDAKKLIELIESKVVREQER